MLARQKSPEECIAAFKSRKLLFTDIPFDLLIHDETFGRILEICQTQTYQSRLFLARDHIAKLPDISDKEKIAYLGTVMHLFQHAKSMHSSIAAHYLKHCDELIASFTLNVDTVLLSEIGVRVQFLSTYQLLDYANYNIIFSGNSADKTSRTRMTGTGILGRLNKPPIQVRWGDASRAIENRICHYLLHGRPLLDIFERARHTRGLIDTHENPSFKPTVFGTLNTEIICDIYTLGEATHLIDDERTRLLFAHLEKNIAAYTWQETPSPTQIKELASERVTARRLGSLYLKGDRPKYSTMVRPTPTVSATQPDIDIPFAERKPLQKRVGERFTEHLFASSLRYDDPSFVRQKIVLLYGRKGELKGVHNYCFNICQPETVLDHIKLIDRDFLAPICMKKKTGQYDPDGRDDDVFLSALGRFTYQLLSSYPLERGTAAVVQWIIRGICQYYLHPIFISIGDILLENLPYDIYAQFTFSEKEYVATFAKTLLPLLQAARMAHRVSVSPHAKHALFQPSAVSPSAGEEPRSSNVLSPHGTSP